MPEPRAFLHEKYQRMLKLRRNEAPEIEAEMRSIAEIYPGVLRETDELPEDEIVRRIALLKPDSQVPEEPWVLWLTRYHEVLRGFLFEKREGRWPKVGAGPVEAAMILLSKESGMEEKLLRKVLFPFSRARRDRIG